MNYYLFGRVKDGARNIVFIGSYRSNEEANKARDRYPGKGYDMDISPPICAESREEAEDRVSLFL